MEGLELEPYIYTLICQVEDIQIKSENCNFLSENLEVYTFQSLFGYHVILGGWQIQSKQRKAITTLSGNHLCLLLSQSEDKRKVHLSFQPE